MPEAEEATAREGDPWVEQGIDGETREVIARFLKDEREAIVEAGTSWVVRTALDLQGRRPREETRELVDRVVDLHLARLLHGQLEPRRRFVGVEEILRFSSLSYAEQLGVLRLVDASSRDAIFEMSDLYVGKLNTEIRRAREQEVRAEAQQAQLQLERERNLALEEATRAAEAANAAKGRFLAHMSHELRTPLNSVIGFSQYLLSDPSLSVQHRRTIDDIHHSGQALLEMINEVLEMSRIEAGALQARVSTVELGPFLQQLHAILVPHVAPGVRFDVCCEGTPEPCFRTDRSKLRQILLNLVGNALKFTQAGHVSCVVRQPCASESGTAWLELVVQDTGPGIAEHELPTMFDAFVQTETGEASGKGVGLGLSIARSYVQLLGGSVRASSIVGEGTTFTISLPVVVVAVATDGREAWPAWSPEQAAALKILVVDDHPQNRELLHLTLARWGFQVREAAGGYEAVDEACAWRPDLVFMDVRMSDLDGLAATRRIHATMADEAPVIVALTASVFGNVRADAMRAGCDEFLLKPFDFATIARVLHERLVRDGPRAHRRPVSVSAASTVLSSAERASLRMAAVQLDLAGLEQWLSKADELDPHTRASFQGWLEEFQFGKVLEWLDT
jgi:signal transduction histidine kinase/DNA-binding response OmpR family regulator